MEFHKLSGAPAEASELESMHSAEGDLKEVELALADPVGYLKAHKLKVTPESQVQVTVKHRSARPAVAGAAPLARARVIIIVAHYRNCDTDIVIIVFR